MSARFGFTPAEALVSDQAARERRQRDWARLRADVAAGGELAWARLAELGPDAATGPTACEGWTVTDVVAHLAGGDELAARALGVGDVAPIEEVDRDRILAAEARTADADLTAAVDRWQAARAELLTAMDAIEGDARYQRVSWVGPPISRIALAQSRVMEDWIHLWDILRPVDLATPVPDRTWWIIDLSVRTVGYGISKAGLTPDLALTLELDGPGGGTWERTFGAGDNPARVGGPTWAWLALVSRRVAPDAALEELEITGDAAARDQIACARAFV